MTLETVTSDILTNIENITGSAFDDFLTGDTVANVINGGGGNDAITGGIGNAVDTIDAGAGVDVVWGDEISVVTKIINSTSNVVVHNYGADIISNAETVYGDAESVIDSILTLSFPTSNGNTITHNFGIDDISGTSTAQTVYGDINTLEIAFQDALSNTLNYNFAADEIDLSANTAGATVVGDVGRITIDPGPVPLSGDQIFYNFGDDVITTGSGNDDIYGDNQSALPGAIAGITQTVSGGNDTIDAGAGNDTIYAGVGADDIDGGADLDTVSYVLSTTGVIVDLSQGAASENIISNGTFTGGDIGDGLDLEGSFLYALNFGGDNASGVADNDFVVIRDATFDEVSTDFTPSGVTLIATNEIINWITPNFGATTNDNNLEYVMQSIRWTNDVNFPVEIHLDVVVGQTYQLQLMFADAAAVGLRGFDIVIEGETIFPDVSVSQGTTSPTFGYVYTYTYIATDTTLDVILPETANSTFSAENSIINGLTLEIVNTVDVLTNVENVTGSAFADRLIGDNLVNVIDGGAGIDVVWGDEISVVTELINSPSNVVVHNYGADTISNAETVYGDAEAVIDSMLTLSFPTSDLNTITHNFGIDDISGVSAAQTVYGDINTFTIAFQNAWSNTLNYNFFG